MAKKKKEKKGKKDTKGKKAKAGKRAKAGAKKTAAPKADRMRALAKHIVKVSTANDDAAILELYAADIESTEMNMPPMVGLEALRAKFEGWNKMVSDPKFRAKNVWVDGNTIVIEWTGDVTLNASGKQAQLREIAIHEIKKGKIARERYYYDPAALQP